ncbi:MAG: hypothetical protein ACFCBV_06155 [Phycisphaerales bacterium]
MRSDCWKIGVAAVALGLWLAAAASHSGDHDVGSTPEAVVTPVQDSKVGIEKADIELIIHRIVPRTYSFEYSRGEWFTATREEAAMLKGVPRSDHPLDGSPVGPRVWFTIVNNTDVGYLISEHTLWVMLRARVDFTDDLDNAYGIFSTAFISFGSEEETYTVPLTPGGQREMVMTLGLSRLQREDEPDPLAPPFAEADAILTVETLSYDIVQRCDLLARPIEDGVLGEQMTLRVRGRGTCEIRFDGPM